MMLLHMLDRIGLSFPSIVAYPIATRLLALIRRDVIVLGMKFEELVVFESVHACSETATFVADIWHRLMYL